MDLASMSDEPTRVDHVGGAMLVPGSLFAERYAIERRLGSGGMGVVFAALDRQLEERVALKVLDAPPDRDQALDRFRREVRLARKVTHPNAARTYDIGEHEGRHYLTMELVDGPSLDKVMRDTPLPFEIGRAAEIGRQIGCGLAAAHAVGIVHRDLKPANVLIEDARVVITDFGIASRVEGEVRMTAAGRFAGTPAYMAPEQVVGARLDTRTDVYALGLILFEMLTGRMAFEAESPIAIAVARVEQDAPDPADLVNLPIELAALVRACLARLPDDRPSAVELAEALAAWAEETGSIGTLGGPSNEARPVPRSSRVASSSASRVQAYPSIALLPLRNVGDDPEQDYFADGLTEDIITELSRFAELMVIAYGTTCAFKGRTTDLQEVGRQLAVEYVALGSVRKAGDRVRVCVELAEAGSGAQLWAERYDRRLVDIFDLQDDIAQAIVAVLPGRVENAVAQRVKRKPPQDMAAYEALLAGRLNHHSDNREDVLRGLELLERAIELDHDYAVAWAFKACTIGKAIDFGWLDAREALPQLFEALERALEIDPHDAECNRLSCEVDFLHADLEKARTHHDKAFALNPNDPRLLAQRGELLMWTGRADEAVAWLEKATRLDPYNAHKRAHLLGRALYQAQSYAEAVTALGKLAHPGARALADMAACHARLDQKDQARERASQVERLEPTFSSSAYVGKLPYAHEADREHHGEGLLAAGLPP
jgi:eukaryotic-like serine/threonine-protein kinase